MKLSIQQSFKLQDFIDTMKKDWGIETITVKEVTNGVMVVTFAKEEELEQVIEEGPWSYRGSSVLMARWRRGCNPETMRFEKLNIWVQVHNLPYELRNPETAEGFAAMAGKVIKAKKSDTNSQKVKFLRVRIKLDITKPPYSGCFLKLKEGVYEWIALKYESMSTFCQNCGRIEHELKACKEGLKEAPAGKWVIGADATVYFEWVKEKTSKPTASEEHGNPRGRYVQTMASNAEKNGCPIITQPSGMEVEVVRGSRQAQGGIVTHQTEAEVGTTVLSEPNNLPRTALPCESLPRRNSSDNMVLKNEGKEKFGMAAGKM